jgi:glycosyltransferase involved in cell wall biosynthesis
MTRERTSSTRTPKTSVIITSFNYAQYLPRAIASVLAQTDEDFELVIVDDSSTDDSAALAQACPDPRVRVIVQPHSGLGTARDTGMRAARGRYVAFLDADDIWVPDKLARQCHVLDHHPDIGLVYTRFGIIDGADRRLSRGFSYLSAKPSGALLPYLLVGNVVGTPSTICFRRELVDTYEVHFDKTGTYIEDWYFYLQLAPHCSFSYVARTLAYHRQHDSNMQSELLVDMTRSFNTVHFGLELAQRHSAVGEHERRYFERRAQAYINAMAGREYIKAGRLDLARHHAARSLRAYPWNLTEAVLYGLAIVGWVPRVVRQQLK